MKLLLYCTKSKPYLIQGFARPFHTKDTTNPFNYKWRLMNYKTQNALNGKVVGECDFEVEEIKRINTVGDWFCYENQDEIMEKSKLDVNKFFDYLQGKNGYAIHIKNLTIFDTPKPLQLYSSMQEEYKAIEKAPQNMCNAYYDEGTKHYILISIRPEWLCKILNGEKTVEIRKKVLRRMLYDIKIIWDVRDFI